MNQELAHFGINGVCWGVRWFYRSRSPTPKVTATTLLCDSSGIRSKEGRRAWKILLGQD